jgi:uncharacterized membrane protein YhaH (DUF805 family)
MSLQLINSVILANPDPHVVKFLFLLAIPVISLIVWIVKAIIKGGGRFYVKCWKHYADFKGRADKKEFWYFSLIHFFVTGLVMSIFLGNLSNLINMGTAVVICLILFIPLCIPALSVSIRRLHDIGQSGWWMLVNIIPLVGQLILLVFFCMNSQSGSNHWGDNPNEENGHSGGYASLSREKTVRANVNETGRQQFKETEYHSMNANSVQSNASNRGTLPWYGKQSSKVIYSQITIGRSNSCDITVDEKYEDVSRNHAVIRIEEGILIFEDTSSNGSYINGKRIHHTRWFIHKSDRVLLGKNYTLRWGDIERFFPNYHDNERKTRPLK